MELAADNPADFIYSWEKLFRMCDVRNKDQETRIKEQETRIKNQGTRLKFLEIFLCLASCTLNLFTSLVHDLFSNQIRNVSKHRSSHYINYIMDMLKH